MQAGHEARPELTVEVLHHRVRRPVVAENLGVTLVAPERQGVLRPACLTRIGLKVDDCRSQPRKHWTWLSKPLTVTGREADVAGHRLRPIGETLVHPVELRVVLVVLEEMLVLVGEDALVQERPTDRIRARVGRRRVAGRRPSGGASRTRRWS